jgi:hypothetical protein
VTSVYSEKLDVFKDACNIAEINRKYAKCFAEEIEKICIIFTWQKIQEKG